LLSKNCQLSTFFRPAQLFEALESIASDNQMYEHGNSDIIKTDQKLYECFKTWTLYKPDLYKYCLPHVNIVNSKCLELKNKHIYTEFYTESPVDIIFEDPSSLFWVHPLINSVIFKNAKITYTWKECCEKFYEFVKNSEGHIISKHDSLFLINEKSILTSILKFSIFHRSQIPEILKQLTCFLGKSNTLLTLCHNLSFTHLNIDPSLLKFLEEIISNNNNLTPYINPYVCI
jgi:hypothetical protein